MIRVHALLVTALVVAGLLAAAPAHAEPSAPPPTGSAWTLTDHLGHGDVVEDHRAVGCVTASECWALTAGSLWRTTDGGSTWVDRFDLMPSDIYETHTIGCRLRDTCYATARTIGGQEVLLVLGRTRVTERVMPSPGYGLDCRTAGRCVAVGNGRSAITTDDGATWAGGNLTDAVFTVSCVPGGSLCLAVGGVDDRTSGGSAVGAAAVSHDGGLTWTDQTAHLTYRQVVLLAVDCESPTTCRAVGTGDQPPTLVTTTDGGTTWTAAPLPASVFELDSLSCSSPVTCGAVGFQVVDGKALNIEVSTTDGTTWTVSPLPTPAAGSRTSAAIACAVQLRCVAVGAVSTYRQVGPDHRWAETQLPVVPARITAVSCRGDRGCVAVGTSAGGVPIALLGTPGAFRVVPMPLTVGVPETIDCVGPVRCVVQSGHDDPDLGDRVENDIWTSADGGRTWTQASTPALLDGYDQLVSCGNPRVCLAAIDNGGADPGEAVSSRDGGVTWQYTNIPGAPTAPAVRIASLSCATAISCVVLDGSVPTTTGSRTANLGTSWLPVRPVASSGPGVETVSCWVTTCLAAGQAVARSADSGQTWSALRLPRGAADLQGLSCSSSGRCAAHEVTTSRQDVVVDTTDAGDTWLRHVTLAEGGGPLACTSSTCLVFVPTDHGVDVYAGS